VYFPPFVFARVRHSTSSGAEALSLISEALSSLLSALASSCLSLHSLAVPLRRAPRSTLHACVSARISLSRLVSHQPTNQPRPSTMKISIKTLKQEQLNVEAEPSDTVRLNLVFVRSFVTHAPISRVSGVHAAYHRHDL